MIATQADREGERALVWLLADELRLRAGPFADLCDALADAWPGQRIGEDGYSEGLRTANRLRIIAKTVRGEAKRMKEAR